MSIIFIDFEASSLSTETWPIEIGLAWIDPAGRLQAEGRLIRPDAGWPQDDWSAESQRVHGIARTELDNADPAAEVARWAVRTIGHATLVSDAPVHDQVWLDRLTGTIGGDPALRIEDFDRAARTWFVGDPVNHALVALYDELRRHPTPHRAAADARNLARAWRAGLRAAKAPHGS
jgi:hypothetical protein